MWYGENRSRRAFPWNVGDLVRYDDGPSALMRIEVVRFMGSDSRGIACEYRYYGRAFHSEGCCTGRYHGQCLEPTPEDIAAWERCHDENDDWIRGMWSASTVSDTAA